MPILLKKDVRAGAAFYERLGFQNHGFWGEGDQLFCIVQRGEVSLGFNTAPKGHPAWPEAYWAAYVYVSDVDALHAEFKDLRVEKMTEPSDRLYGCRDFEIVDEDGHRIAFGQDIYTETGLPGLATETS